MYFLFIFFFYLQLNVEKYSFFKNKKEFFSFFSFSFCGKWSLNNNYR
jgi:hypothetical protein